MCSGHDAVNQVAKMDLCGMRLLGTKVCKKHDLGVHNNLFGGTMLSWIDELAVAFVNEVCFSPNMVTLKVEEVLFKSPVKENNLIKIYGDIVRIGNKLSVGPQQNKEFPRFLQMNHNPFQ